MSALVQCRDLVCRLGGRLVLDGVDLDIAEGQALAMAGCSGSGKSTLLRIVAGLEVPERGDVTINGQAATREGRLLVPPHRRGTAMLFQDLALWPNLSSYENVRLGLSGSRLTREDRRRRAQEALTLCGIADLASRLPGSLSGGQQQRVALARALAVQPRLLLLDEPFGGLDLLTKRAVIGEVCRLKSTLAFALVLVAHDPLEARQLCDSLVVLDGGRVVDNCPLAGIATQARTPLAKAFA